MEKLLLGGSEIYQRYAAGVLPYTITSDNRVYFLLGEDSSENKWSDFGGKSKSTDRNLPENTAIREFYEETLGSIYSKRELIGVFSKNKIPFITSATLRQDPYYMYLLKIPYLATYHTRFTIFRDFLENQTISNHPTEFRLKFELLEKKRLRWVSLEQIQSILNGVNRKTSIPLRPIFESTLKRHFHEIIEAIMPHEDEVS